MAKKKKSPEDVPEWTVMILMGADNLTNETDLSAFAEADLQEMESVPAHPSLNIVVQLDQTSDAAPIRYVINGPRTTLTGANCVPAGQKRTGPEVLENFVAWAKQKYEAKHYMLVLWGHAYRLAFNRSPSDPDGLDFPELAAVLAKTNQKKKIDIIAFDSCNVSLIESAHQLRNVAKYMVASQFSDPLPGWEYGVVLGRDFTSQASSEEVDGATRDFGRAIVSQFVRNYTGHENVTMTMLDLARADEIAARIRDLAVELILTLNADPAEHAAVQAMFERSQVPLNQPAVDLATFCWNLLNFSGDEKVRIAAAALGDLLLRPTNPFVVAHGKSDLLVSMLQGVSILAPNIVNATAAERDALRASYQKLDMAEGNLWGDLVFTLAANR